MVTAESHDTRIAALIVRRGIEANWNCLRRDTCAGRKPRVKPGLRLLASRVPDEHRLGAFRAAEHLAFIYEDTSNVLHGRSSAINHGLKVVSAWNDGTERFRTYFDLVEWRHDHNECRRYPRLDETASRGADGAAIPVSLAATS